MAKYHGNVTCSQGWTIYTSPSPSRLQLDLPRNRARDHPLETLSRLVTATRCISAQYRSLARLIQFATPVPFRRMQLHVQQRDTAKYNGGGGDGREIRSGSETVPGSRLCFRGRKFRVGQPDDGLPRRHGRRGRRSHPRELESRKRDVASAQREPAGTLLAGWDEASSASTRATPFPSSPAHGRASSTATATAAASRGLHAAVLLVPGGSQSRTTHVSAASPNRIDIDGGLMHCLRKLEVIAKLMHLK